MRQRVEERYASEATAAELRLAEHRTRYDAHLSEAVGRAGGASRTTLSPARRRFSAPTSSTRLGETAVRGAIRGAPGAIRRPPCLKPRSGRRRRFNTRLVASEAATPARRRAGTQREMREAGHATHRDSRAGGRPARASDCRHRCVEARTGRHGPPRLSPHGGGRAAAEQQAASEQTAGAVKRRFEGRAHTGSLEPADAGAATSRRETHASACRLSKHASRDARGGHAD